MDSTHMKKMFHIISNQQNENKSTNASSYIIGGSALPCDPATLPLDCISFPGLLFKKYHRLDTDNAEMYHFTVWQPQVWSQDCSRAQFLRRLQERLLPFLFQLWLSSGIPQCDFHRFLPLHGLSSLSKIFLYLSRTRPPVF